MRSQIGRQKKKPGRAQRRHPVSMCDRLLRRDPSYNTSRCEPKEWTCECGRVWGHVCDEAEGCFYSERRR